jgi:hypothetical protein
VCANRFAADIATACFPVTTTKCKAHEFLGDSSVILGKLEQMESWKGLLQVRRTSEVFEKLKTFRRFVGKRKTF